MPPKPEGQKKKEERDLKIAQNLKELREKRRIANKAKRQEALQRSQSHEAAYNAFVKSEIEARRNVHSQ